ncbi:MAG: hypothetical protein A3J75_02860 [Acidobacteria bacterium RBG_16_68_9]|nr:MAG: hypothetical protein A3J75_02860 [Acidobacteria bacterium RBG_16_68_9]
MAASSESCTATTIPESEDADGCETERPRARVEPPRTDGDVRLEAVPDREPAHAIHTIAQRTTRKTTASSPATTRTR